MRVDCSYLITAWSSESSTSRALDEHRLLSEVMRALLRHPALPEVLLQGRLRGQGAASPDEHAAARPAPEPGRVLASAGRQTEGRPELHGDHRHAGGRPRDRNGNAGSRLRCSGSANGRKRTRTVAKRSDSRQQAPGANKGQAPAKTVEPRLASPPRVLLQPGG